MDMSSSTSGNNPQELPRFHSVSETAEMLGVSEMTLYRQIRANSFPAIRVGGRLVVPARYVQEMVEAAINQMCVVDPSNWVGAESEGAH
jgi:excisionase family DNA binding protein